MERWSAEQEPTVREIIRRTVPPGVERRDVMWHNGIEPEDQDFEPATVDPVRVARRLRRLARAHRAARAAGGVLAALVVRWRRLRLLLTEEVE